MRVLMTAAQCWPKLGGVERHVESVRCELARLGHDVMVAELGLGARGALGLKRLLAILRAGRYEVVHAHDFFPALVTWIGMRLCRYEAKLYVTIHGYEGFPLKPHYIAGHRLAQSVAEKVIAIGSYIDRWYGTSSTLVLHGGVTETTGVRTRAQRSVVFLGRLAADTNCKEVAAAFVRCSERQPGVAFEIYGFGPLADAVAGICANTAVEFRGATVEPEKNLARAGVVIANSYLTILEAFALGKPVVGYCDNPLKADYLNEMARASSGMLVTNTQRSLEDAISKLIADSSERERLGSRAAAYAKRFLWRNVAADYDRLWRTP